MSKNYYFSYTGLYILEKLERKQKTFAQYIKRTNAK